MILQYQNKAALQYDDHVFFWKGIHRQERKLFDRREQVFYTILKSDMSYFGFLFILVISMLFSRGSVAKITQNCLEILRIRLAGKRGIVLQSLYAPHGYRQ